MSFSLQACKEGYRDSWPVILLATSIWLKRNDFGLTSKEAKNGQPQCDEDTERERQLFLIMGMCVEALWQHATGTVRPTVSPEAADRTVLLCLDSLVNVLHCEWASQRFIADVQLPIELMNVLYRHQDSVIQIKVYRKNCRLILTNNNLHVQLHCVDVVQVS